MKLICLSFQTSHMIPIVNYILNQNIDDCIFFGDESLKKYINDLGFIFVQCKSKKILNVLTYRKNKQKKELSLAYQELHNELEEIINKHKITEMVCDISRYMYYAPLAYKKNIPITIFWTYNGPTHFNTQALPQTSQCFEKHTKLICIYEWIKQFYIGEVRSNKIFFYLSYPYNFMLSPKHLFNIRYSIDGFFVNTQKIVCGPDELCPFRDKKTNFDKPIISYSPHKSKRFEKPHLPAYIKKTIYFSFGTNNLRYKNGLGIMKHVLECFSSKTDIQLILNLGEIEEDITFNINSENIIVVKNIDQQEIIKNVDCVIFHGGFGTLKECIYHSKKMIVIPFAYDQFANAKLVERLNMGKYVPEKDCFNIDFYNLLKTVLGEF